MQPIDGMTWSHPLTNQKKYCIFKIPENKLRDFSMT